jgi:demethylspheroidene O-methyltransferase
MASPPPLPVLSALPQRPAGGWRLRWHDAWLGWRNRLIADPGFQRWAARFPLTRRVARQRVRTLFDLVAGFVYSQILAACVELDLFTLLANGPQTVAALAPRLRLTEGACDRLLKAAAALGLCQALPDGRFALGQLGAALSGNPGVVAMIRHHAMLYADLQDPLALLRGEAATPQLQRYWAYARSADPGAAPPELVGAYSDLMAASQAMVAEEVLGACRLDRYHRLLDVGGGEGVFLSHAARQAPDLGLMLFDLPAVAARARARFDAAGLSARASVHGGSFLADPLPTGADIVSLVRVLHDHDDEAALTILRRAHAALPPGGTLLVAEPMSGTPGALPAGDAYFGFYLAAMGSGRPRTPVELADFITRAGFHRPRLLPTATPLIVRVMVAVA